MRSAFFAALLALVAILCVAPARAAEYYVSPNGSDTAAGTSAAPFKTVGRAQTAAAAGDTVWIHGGTYAFTGSGTVGVAFSKSGSANSLIKYWAVAGETPVFDLGNLTPSNRVTGLDVHCNYIHLRGLEVKGVKQYMSGQDSWGVRIQGNNNILENLNVHHNDAPGVFITSGSGNLVLNCDSHHNYDQLEGGGSGDGFGCHSSGGSNVLRGCRGFDNSDDGYDFINAAGSCLVEKSFSYRNGWVPDTKTAAGNGAGFKAGGYGSPPTVPSGGAATHTVQQCVAFGNRSQGFYANHHPGRINFYNNTGFNNPVNFNMLADSGYPSSHVIRNNIAMATGTAISNLTGGTDTFNSWTLSVTASSADFISVNLADAEAPRQADGSLPNNSFVRLVTGSDLIDKGTDVGLAFNGSAPDLGAFESGGTTTGSGGATGAGGATTATGGRAATGGAASGGTTAAMGGTTAAMGGRAATGGGSQGGGTAQQGGAQNRGGTAGQAGAVASNGGTSTSSGGSTTSNNGGSANPSGGSTNASGGSIGTSNGGGTSTGNGGTVASNGGSGTTGSGGSANPGSGGSVAAGRGGSSGDAGGCSCSVPGAHSAASSAPFALFGLALVSTLRRRRRAV